MEEEEAKALQGGLLNITKLEILDPVVCEGEGVRKLFRGQFRVRSSMPPGNIGRIGVCH